MPHSDKETEQNRKRQDPASKGLSQKKVEVGIQHDGEWTSWMRLEEWHATTQLKCEIPNEVANY